MWRHPARSASALANLLARLRRGGLLGLCALLALVALIGLPDDSASAQTEAAATDSGAAQAKVGSRKVGGSKVDTIETVETGPYEGTWEYRWGDSPHSGSGEFLWAQAGSTPDKEWHRCKPPGTPPGRQGSKFLWMRTRLVGPRAHDPAMFLLLVDQIFEAYLDGVLIHRFGVLDGPGAGQLAGWAPHYLPLGKDYQGKLLTLRIYSEHFEIGIMGPMQIGDRLALTVAQMRNGQDLIIVGSVLIILALVSLGIYVGRRQEQTYLSYGGFALSAGVYMCTYSQSRTLELENPVFWSYVELFTLYLMPPFLIRYLIGLIGRGPRSLTYRLMQLFWAYWVGAALLVATGLIPLVSTLIPFNMLFMFTIIYVMGMSVIAAIQGNAEARIFCAGLAVASVFVVYDILAVLGVVPRLMMLVSHIGAAVFVASLAIIPIRRIVMLQKDRVRAMQLEVERVVNQQRLDEQSALLNAAMRMAKGDLATSIAVKPESPLRHLSEALEGMRKDLQQKFQQLHESNAKVQSLNEELMRQIEQRSRRLLDTLLARKGAGVQAAPPLEPGATLGDVYKVIRSIGQGASGAVYEVERKPDGKRLAAKVLSGEVDKPTLVRFAREAQLLSKLAHPNLISIYDVEVTPDGTLFLVMELVKGTTLRNLRHCYGNPAWALRILRQIALALVAVHERSIVHRDLKPANILIADGVAGGPEVVKLADFGVSVLARRDLGNSLSGRQISPLAALLTDEPEFSESTMSPIPMPEGDSTPSSRTNPTPSSSRINALPASARSARPDDLTEIGMLVGTPMYMAPEISFGSRHAQPSSDIFSLGVIAYELIVGDPPFKKPPIGAMVRHEALRIPPGLRHCPALDQDLCDLLERALSSAPAQRPTAADLARALSRFV